MRELLVVLTPIALVDALSPSRIAPMVTFLGGRRPFRDSLEFVLGCFLGYLVLGVAFALGADGALDALFPEEPPAIDFALGAVLGAVLVFFGVRGWRAGPRPRPSAGARPVATGRSTVWLALAVTFVTAPAALPYFAGIQQILKAPIDDESIVLALLYYCGVFVVPFLAMILVRARLGAGATRYLETLNAAVERWLPRVVSSALVLLGVVLVIDAIGYFAFDRPLW